MRENITLSIQPFILRILQGNSDILPYYYYYCAREIPWLVFTCSSFFSSANLVLKKRQKLPKFGTTWNRLLAGFPIAWAASSPSGGGGVPSQFSGGREIYEIWCDIKVQKNPTKLIGYACLWADLGGAWQTAGPPGRCRRRTAHTCGRRSPRTGTWTTPGSWWWRGRTLAAKPRQSRTIKEN